MDSSTVEHYTVNVEEEAHRFLKNDEKNKAGLFTGRKENNTKWTFSETQFGKHLAGRH